MKKVITLVTILGVFGLYYSIFLKEESEYIAGETRYYTVYEKYKGKNKKVASTRAYDNDNYNLEGLKDKTQKEIDRLEEFRNELKTVHNSLFNSNNDISDFENYISKLENLRKIIEDNKELYNRQKNDLSELKEFIWKMEPSLKSIELYQIDIDYVSTIIQSIDSTSSKYINSANLMIYASASNELKLIKEIEAENEREHQEMLNQKRIEEELVSLDHKREMDLYNNLTSFPSNNIDMTIWNDFTNSSMPTANYTQSEIFEYPTSRYATDANPNHVQVDGHFRANGTYVESYMRTEGDDIFTNNFSESPNLNPYTGKIGTRKHK